MNSLSLKTNLVLKLLEKAKFGHVEIYIGTNNKIVAGEGPFVSQLILKDESVFNKIISQGDIGLAESVMAGDLEISNTTEFVRWACLNDDVLKSAFHGNIFGTFFHKVERFFQANTVKGSKQNIMAHYDLGNEFYDKWLDPSMSYSAAIFEQDENKQALTRREQEDFTIAQNRKYDRIINGLGIKSGDRILEIGGGWGGFFSRAIEQADCHVTSVMNSPSQHSYNQKLIKDRHFSKNVDLQLLDYRNIKGTYDKIVSIEMVEAVGEKYWPTYFNKIKESLKPLGTAMIQSITIKEDRFDEYRSSTDFIKKYVFPGGMLLTNNNIAKQANKADLKSGTPFDFGLGYAETLKRWRVAFNHSLATGALNFPDEKFIKLWNFYLSYCEGAFLAGRINVTQIELEN